MDDSRLDSEINELIDAVVSQLGEVSYTQQECLRSLLIAEIRSIVHTLTEEISRLDSLVCTINEALDSDMLCKRVRDLEDELERANFRNTLLKLA